MSQDTGRGLISDNDRKSRVVRHSLSSLQVVVLALLALSGLGPLLWLAKASVSSSQEIIREPLRLLPSEFQWENLSQAWFGNQIGLFLFNSSMLAIGCIVTNLIVSTTVAYTLSVLRPRWGPALSAAILATLFIPTIVALVPLYLTILDLPLVGVSLLGTYWAVWLPAAASPFNILIVKRFFDSLPQEIFEAARVDGAGALRVYFLIVLPLSKPILGVVALLAAITSWKDFLWPLLVLPDPQTQPVSVALSKIATTSDLSSQLASLFLSLILPVAVFLVFQRQFLRGVAMTGAIKE